VTVGNQQGSSQLREGRSPNSETVKGGDLHSRTPLSSAKVKMGSRAQRVIYGALGVLVLLVVWEVVSRSGSVDARYLPPPTVVFAELARLLLTQQFWQALAKTMTSWAIGLVVVSIAGIVAGFVIGLSPFLKRYTNSTIEFLRPIPSVALIPLAVLVFGVRMESALLLIIYACFWQMLIQILYGVEDVDPVAIDTARTYGLNWFARVRYIVWPSSLPYLFTGLRLAATIALVLAITAELVIGVPGLGTEITLAQNGARVPTVYALTFATGVLGLIVNLIMRAIETNALAWHSSIRAEAGK